MKRLLIGAAVLGFALGAAVLVHAQSDSDATIPNTKLVGLEHAGKTPALRLRATAEQLSLVDNGSTRCALDSLGGGPCSTTAVIERGASVEVTLCEDDLPIDRIRVHGVAPTGARSVTVSYENGERYEGAIGGGVFGVEPPAPNRIESLPKALIFALDTGATIQAKLPVVEAAYMDSCVK